GPWGRGQRRAGGRWRSTDVSSTLPRSVRRRRCSTRRSRSRPLSLRLSRRTPASRRARAGSAQGRAAARLRHGGFPRGGLRQQCRLGSGGGGPPTKWGTSCEACAQIGRRKRLVVMTLIDHAPKKRLAGAVGVRELLGHGGRSKGDDQGDGEEDLLHGCISFNGIGRLI